MKKSNINNIHISNIPEKLKRKYRIVSPISYSEKSSVYLLNEHIGNDKSVLKIVYANHHTSKLAEKLSSLSSEYICKPLEYCIKSNLIYIVYPYFTPLTELLMNSSLSLEEILSLGIDICKALLYLHKNNIMHLDVSAGNIFKDNNGHYLLGDYSNAVFVSSIKDNIDNELKSQMDVCICDCRSLVIFLLTLLNNGEYVEAVCMSMEKELPEELLSVFSFSDINFLDEDKILEELCSALYEIKDCESILNSNYRIRISSKNHELIAKKTVPIKFINTERNGRNKISINIINNINKINNIKKFIPYIALLLCGLIFIFSFYSFIVNNKNTKNNENYISETNNQVQIDDKDFVCDVSDIGIKSFPNDIYSMNLNKYKDLSDISIIYAHSNKITSLSGIEECGDIRELYLSDNKLSDLKDIKRLKNIEVLVLSYNDVRDITMLSELNSLVFLDLSGNRGLENIQVLSKLTNLQILVLSGTGISKEEIDLLQKNLPDCEVIE